MGETAKKQEKTEGTARKGYECCVQPNDNRGCRMGGESDPPGFRKKIKKKLVRGEVPKMGGMTHVG